MNTDEHIAASRKQNIAQNNAAARRRNAPTNGGIAAWKATLRWNRRGARIN